MATMMATAMVGTDGGPLDTDPLGLFDDADGRGPNVEPYNAAVFEAMQHGGAPVS